MWEERTVGFSALAGMVSTASGSGMSMDSSRVVGRKEMTPEVKGGSECPLPGSHQISNSACFVDVFKGISQCTFKG